jgi:alpha-glucoside transport system permease protein
MVGDIAGKFVSTLITVVIAVAVSGGVWVGANLLFNQVRTAYVRYRALAWGACGFGAGVLFSGNQITAGSTSDGGGLSSFGAWVWLPLVTAVAVGAVGAVLAVITEPLIRHVVGVIGLGAAGGVLGGLVRSEWRPDVAPVALIVITLVVAAIPAATAIVTRRDPLPGALSGAALGWVIGAWGVPDLGDGSSVWSVIAVAVPGALIGLRAARSPIADRAERNRIDARSRAVVFLGPALLFIFGALVVPTIRTVYLSLLDRDSEEFVWFSNYVTIFRDPKAIDLTMWSSMFTSRLFWIGIVLLAVFVALGVRDRRQTGRVVELGSAGMGPLLVGGVLVAFAVFTTLRGTLINNLWWVLAVTLFSTSLGLAIAVLADGARFERVAKAVIFMPMAISLVGASVVWRFMYIARDSSKSQTGVMNALWVGLGRLSTGDGLPTLIVGVLVLVLLLALVVAVARRLSRGEPARAAAPAVVAVLLGWFAWRYWGVTGGGVGGFRFNDAGVQLADPINFIQEPPFNNFWLMVVLIWIQTGFAMVILSAAIKAVPTELIEAARVDGADDTQIFWRVTLPQIATTIGVVVTTLIVLVMKVFDIVKVMTNGNFGTEVLANNMYREAFSNFNTGVGAALAALIFLSVVPVMFINIRRMQREG